MITMGQFAAVLDGREYGNEITKKEEADAKANGFVVVFGYSDDNMEFRGAIFDELSCYGGGEAFVTKDGILMNECDGGDDCPYFAKVCERASKIEALWCAENDGPAWTYKTDIPHCTFIIKEDGEPFCRGIVFALSDVP